MQNFGKSAGTVTAAFTAIKSTCKAYGHSLVPFNHPQVLMFIRALRKQKKASIRPLRLPITIWALAKFLLLVDLSLFADHMFFAAMVIGFYGFLRASEFLCKAPYGCTLLRRHVTILTDRVVLHLARSKTDTYDEGIDVVLFANHGALCPRAWALWVWENAPAKTPDSPFFQTQRGLALPYAAFQSFIKKLGDKAGWDASRCSSHSLRIGACTTLIELGFPPSEVKDIGRWLSDCYVTYVRVSDNHRRNVSAAFFKAAKDSDAPVFCGVPLADFQKINSATVTGFKASSSRS
jgi:hypothetical protein